MAAAATAPLAVLMGWRMAIASWVVMLVLAVLVWTLRMRQVNARPGGQGSAAAAPERSGEEAHSSRRSAWKEPAAWPWCMGWDMRSPPWGRC